MGIRNQVEMRNGKTGERDKMAEKDKRRLERGAGRGGWKEKGRDGEE